MKFLNKKIGLYLFFYIYLTITKKNKRKIMRIQALLEEAKYKYLSGYSQSRVVQFVYENANNDTQATKVLNIVFGTIDNAIDNL